LKPNTFTGNAVQLLAWREGRLSGAADPRKQGLAETR
jgi:hypothetical protein